MRLKDFIVESDTLKMLHHFKRFSAKAKNIDFAYGAENPEGKYFKFSDVESLLADHGSRDIQRFAPIPSRSGFNLYASMVDDSAGAYVAVHDVINAISKMHDD